MLHNHWDPPGVTQETPEQRDPSLPTPPLSFTVTERLRGSGDIHPVFLVQLGWFCLEQFLLFSTQEHRSAQMFHTRGKTPEPIPNFNVTTHCSNSVLCLGPSGEQLDRLPVQSD